MPYVEIAAVTLICRLDMHNYFYGEILVMMTLLGSYGHYYDYVFLTF